MINPQVTVTFEPERPPQPSREEEALRTELLCVLIACFPFLGWRPVIKFTRKAAASLQIWLTGELDKGIAGQFGLYFLTAKQKAVSEERDRARKVLENVRRQSQTTRRLPRVPDRHIPPSP